MADNIGEEVAEDVSRGCFGSLITFIFLNLGILALLFALSYKFILS